MELKGIIAVYIAKNDEEKVTSYCEKWSQNFSVLCIQEEMFLKEEWLNRWEISPEDVLVLCPTEESIQRGKSLGLATVAYAEPGSEYSFPSARLVMEGIAQYEGKDLEKAYQREKRLPWEIMRTNRLIIREETPEDVDRLYEIYESPSVKRYLEPLFEREREKEYLRNYYDYIYTFYEYGMWHLVLKETGIGIGRAGITPKVYKDGASGGELGYLIDEQYQRQGYCMEACRAIIEYAKEQLEIENLYCLIRPENHRSMEICEALGFVYEKDVFEEDRNMRRYIRRLHLE